MMQAANSQCRWKEELAWAAGVLDGEGSICVTNHYQRDRRRPQPMPRVAVTQSGNNLPDMISRLKQALSVGNVHGPYKHQHGGKDYWRFDVTRFAHVQAIIAMVWHWLGPEKRINATKTLQSMAAHRDTLSRRTSL